MHKAQQSKGYTGERLVEGVSLLKPVRFENRERFRFFLSQAAGGRILDLGCGTGEGSKYLSQTPGWDITAVDFSFEALSGARSGAQPAPVHWANMDGQVLGFANRFFDAVVSIEVIEHIPDPLRYLQEIRRVLKPGGLVMISTPNRLLSSPTPGSLWPEHLREYDPAELAALLNTTFSSVSLWGESVPVYEQHPLRRLVRRLAPAIKPILPHWLRVRALHAVQTLIKPDLEQGDVVFSQNNIAALPTLVALCRG